MTANRRPPSLRRIRPIIAILLFLATSLSGVGAPQFANGTVDGAPLAGENGYPAIRSLERCDGALLAPRASDSAKLPLPNWAGDEADAPEESAAARRPTERTGEVLEARAPARVADRFLLEWLGSSGRIGVPPPVSTRGA